MTPVSNEPFYLNADQCRDIRIALAGKDWTQARLAKECRISQPKLSQTLTRMMMVKPAELARIHKALGIVLIGK